MERDKIFDGGFYHTEGTPRIRENGHYQLRLYYTDAAGKRCRKAFDSASVKKCYEKAVDFYYEYNGLICRPSSSIPEILEAKYRNDLSLNFIKEQTCYQNIAETHVFKKHIIGQLPIRDVTPKIIDSFLQSVTDYADGTIEGFYIALKTAFKIAKDEEVISKNLMKSKDIRRPKSTKAAKKVMALTIEEQKLILRDITTRKPPYGAADYRKQFLIQLYSGMRMGEINALTPEDIDFDRNVIHVTNTVVTIGSKTQLGDTAKTFAGEREIPISVLLKPVLEDALAAMRQNELNLIFYDYRNNSPFATRKLSASFSRACRRAGIKSSGSHVLRHTFATRCIEAGISAIVLKNWLGHTDIHVTLDTYADVFDRMNNSAVNSLDAYLEAIEKEEINN